MEQVRDRVTDTYELNLSATETDTLAEFRHQVKQQTTEKSERGKLSEAALQKLRLIREQDRVQEAMDARFAAALKCVIVSPENLFKLLVMCNTSVPVKQLDRCAHKLNFWITAGFRLGEEIDSVTMLNFLSELVPDEVTMSDSRFFGLWALVAAEKMKASRLSRGLIELGLPKVRPCKSGKKCMRFEKRKPAPAKGNGEYCGPACGASDRARAKRGLAAIPTVQ